MIKEENVEFLNQLIKSLEAAEARLDYVFRSKNTEDFNKIKKFILEIQDKIVEILG